MKTLTFFHYVSNIKSRHQTIKLYDYITIVSSLKQLCLQTIIDYQLPIDRLPVTMQTLM
jgi:hypothetical protein